MGMKNQLFILYLVICLIQLTIAIRTGSKKTSGKKTAAGKIPPKNFSSDDNCFHIKSAKTGKYLSINRGGRSLGFDTNKSVYTEFCLQPQNDGNGHYFIHLKNDYSQVLDVFRNLKEVDTEIIHYPKHGGKNQQFIFVPYYGEDYLIEYISYFLKIVGKNDKVVIDKYDFH